jgi:putative oxidoreductase
LKNLGVPAPEFWCWIGALVEFVIGAALVLRFATRYAALLCALFLIVATALAHRYWEYPAAQVIGQYNIGGALLIFAAEPGRFSVDRMLSNKG